MTEPSLAQHEAVAQYSDKQIMTMTRAAHDATVRILEDIAEHLTPGVTEAEVRDAAEGVFSRYGIEKHWHRPYIYFGAHTHLTAYDAKPKDIITLGADDIAYIDIGAVIQVDGVNVEGDVGRTFVFGQRPLFLKLKQTAEEVFQSARDYWHCHQPTGIELYRYIHRLTEEAGYTFQLQPAGHLIGSFPHLGWKKGLNTYPHTPEPGIWILEIQMRDPETPYGAFFEEVLL